MQRLAKRPFSLLRYLSTWEKVICALFFGLIFLTIFGPMLAPLPTEEADASATLLPPSSTHWFGTDESGMDIFSRVLAAPRTDVLIAVIATSISIGVGAPLGALAGFYEGGRRRTASALGEIMLRLLDVIQAFPVFILAMVLVAVRGANPVNLVIAIAFVNIPIFIRLARTEVLSLKTGAYAEAAKAVGGSDRRIAFVHLLPNAMPSLIVQLSVTVGLAILLTAGLSFIGAGITPPTPELGAMIAVGAKYMALGQWWPAVFPGLALGATVFIFAAFGEVLGSLLDPAQRQASGSRRGTAIQTPDIAGVVAQEAIGGPK